MAVLEPCEAKLESLQKLVTKQQIVIVEHEADSAELFV